MRMIRIKQFSRLLFFIIYFTASTLYLSGCGDKNKETLGKGQNNKEIVVSAAASLSECYTEIARNIKQEKNINVILNFGGSQSLASGIEQGANVDVFASANTNYMNKLKDKNLIEEDKIFAKNALVVCKNSKSNIKVESLKDLGNPSVKLIVGDKTVPVGEYFYTILENSVKENIITEAEKSNIIKNIRSNELNVKDVVGKVLLGEGDVGVVYKTDINDSNKNDLHLIELKEFGMLKAEYPIGILVNSTKEEAAREFVNYMINGSGKEILKKYGFIVE